MTQSVLMHADPYSECGYSSSRPHASLDTLRLGGLNSLSWHRDTHTHTLRLSESLSLTQAHSLARARARTHTHTHTHTHVRT